MRHLAQASDAQLRIGESIIPAGAMDSGLVLRTPRNDGREEILLWVQPVSTCPVPIVKIFLFPFYPNHLHISRIPPAQRGEILSDNGAEFASRNNLEEHPFEAMLLELGIKHRYTRPYRPQTNGKIERFWRTLDEDLIEGTTFDNLDHFANELFEYLIYYNNYRPHQALNGKTPKEFAAAKTTPPQSAN
jgi:hypothetical protein